MCIRDSSHTDHYGGVKGIISEADVKSGKVQVIAPAGFMDEAISENMLAGNIMSQMCIRDRRARAWRS